MTLDQDSVRLLSPKETVDYLKMRWSLSISISTFYSNINRGVSPTPTYFRNLPKFTTTDIDEWVRNNLSNHRCKLAVLQRWRRARGTGRASTPVRTQRNLQSRLSNRVSRFAPQDPASSQVLMAGGDAGH
jgi:predicted DNA-binding transcriptional regulator AlpA